MRKLVILIVLLLLLSVKTNASEIMRQQAELFGVEALEDAIPSDAKEFMKEIPLEGQDFTDGVSEIAKSAVSKSGGYFRASAALLLKILLILLLCRLADGGTQGHVGQTVAMTGVFSMTMCCAADLRVMIGLGKQTMDELMDFSTLLLPVMASASAASGSLTGAGILYGVAVFFAKILIGFCGKVLIPLVYAFLALGVVDAALQESRLAKLQAFLSWVIRWGLKAIMYLFTGFLAVTGILSGTVDTTALKTAGATLSGMVPVVGSIISDAAQSVLYSAGLLKSAIGTFGLLAFLAVFTAPFFRLGLHYLAFRMTSVLAGLMGSKLVGFVDCIMDVMSFLLAMLGSCVLMCMLSCFCFMRVVGI